MAIVSELLVHGGTLPQLAELQKKKTFFNKKNGVVFSAIWFIFFTMFMTSFWGILNVDELAGLSAIIGVFGSLCLLIASLVILPSSKLIAKLPIQEMPVAPAQPAGLYGNPAQQALPPQQQQPASFYAPPQQGSWRAPDTGDLAERPGSVIEDTTKLLKKEKDL